ncbi:MAG: hypothetical protein IJW24_01705 [Clostridia bacterium]|nr:hypothetical protein [Clostridia bacterium]
MENSGKGIYAKDSSLNICGTVIEANNSYGIHVNNTSVSTQKGDDITQLINNQGYGLYAENNSHITMEDTEVCNNIYVGIYTTNSTLNIGSDTSVHDHPFSKGIYVANIEEESYNNQSPLHIGQDTYIYGNQYGLYLENVKYSEIDMGEYGYISKNSYGVYLSNTTLYGTSGVIGNAVRAGNNYGVWIANAGSGTSSHFYVNGENFFIQGNETGIKNSSNTRVYLNEGSIQHNNIRGVESSGYFYMYGGQICNNGNGEYDGGGLYITTVPKLEGGVIYNNKGKNGGGIYLRESKYNYVFKDVEIYNNIADNGAGIYIEGTENVSQSIKFQGTQFSGNQATGSGGAMSINSQCEVVLESIVKNNETILTTISGNSAQSGGGIHATSSQLTLNGAVIDSNTAYSGGGIYFSGSNLTFNEGRMSKNKAAHSGSAIFCTGSNDIVIKQNVTIVDCSPLLDNDTLHGTIALRGREASPMTLDFYGEIKLCSAYLGGGIFTFPYVNVNMFGEINGCSSSYNGGAMYLGENSVANISGIIRYCNANTDPNIGRVGRGGGIYVSSSSSVVNMNSSAALIYACSADMGGGIYVQEGSANLYAGEISNNYARCGGGISANKAEINIGEINSSEIFSVKNNTATLWGGGAYIAGSQEDRSTCNILDGGLIGYNEIKNLGDGNRDNIYNYKYENQTKGVGGGVVLNFSDMVMSGGTINENFVGDDGYASVSAGGIAVANTSSLEMRGGTILSNVANIEVAESYAGNVRVDEDAVFKMYGGTIKYEGDSQQAKIGGGIFNEGETQMFGGLIAQCKAVECGGGILNVGTLIITGGEISECEADCGGGIASYYGFDIEESIDEQINDVLTKTKLTIDNGDSGDEINIYGNKATASLDNVSGELYGDSILVGGEINLGGTPNIKGHIVLATVTGFYETENGVAGDNLFGDTDYYPTMNVHVYSDTGFGRYSIHDSSVEQIKVSFCELMLTVDKNTEDVNYIISPLWGDEYNAYFNNGSREILEYIIKDGVNYNLTEIEDVLIDFMFIHVYYDDSNKLGSMDWNDFISMGLCRIDNNKFYIE